MKTRGVAIAAKISTIVVVVLSSCTRTADFTEKTSTNSVVLATVSSNASPTPTPKSSATPTPTASSSPTASPTPTASPSPTATPTPSPTASPSPTATPVVSGTYAPLNYSSSVTDIEFNPLKGYVPHYNDTNYTSVPATTTTQAHKIPWSMEDMNFRLSDVMTSYSSTDSTGNQAAINQFDWTKFETALGAVAKRGNQAVASFFIDWPHSATGLPTFLQKAPFNMTFITNSESTTTPNWNDSNLITAMTNFITALGAKYDGDARIAYLGTALYGYWAEQHTNPNNAGTTLNLEMTNSNKVKFLNAYVSSFKDTNLYVTMDMLKIATDTNYYFSDLAVDSSNRNLFKSFGIWDGSFAYETISTASPVGKSGSWFFQDVTTAVKLDDFWKTHAMGGEVRPEVGGSMPTVSERPQSDGQSAFDSLTTATPAPKWPETKGLQAIVPCIQTVHATWMEEHEMYNTNDPSVFAGDPLYEKRIVNLIATQKMMGYEYYVSQVKIPSSVSSGSAFSGAIKTLNKGVAPIYKNWATEIYAYNKSTKVKTKLGTTGWDWRTILPSSVETELTFSFNQSLATGNYDLLVQIVNPLPGGHFLKFANETQDATVTGYLTLGSFSVK